MKVFLLIVILGIMWYINYRYNNIIIKTYNQANKIPKFLIIGVSILALLAPSLLKNNLVLDYFKGVVPESVNKQIDTYQEVKEKVQRKPNGTIKRNVTESTKKYVASNQGWKCLKCGQTLDATYEVDHVKPLHQGGTNDISNLRALCRNCHGKKTLEDNMRRKKLL